MDKIINKLRSLFQTHIEDEFKLRTQLADALYCIDKLQKTLREKDYDIDLLIEQVRRYEKVAEKYLKGE